MLTVGTIINGGVTLVRERPVSVLTWGLVYIATIVGGVFAVLAPLFRAQFAMMSGATPPGTLPPGFNPLALMGQVYLFDFVILVLLVVLLAAGTRAVLRPDASAFAYMRLGMDELRLLGLCLLALICFIAAGMVFGIVLGIVMVATGGLSPDVGFGGVHSAIFAITFALAAAMVYLQVRLSPALALTMVRDRITVGEAWRLTRGRFWTLFGGYFVLWLILVVAYVAIVSLVAFPILHAMMTMPGMTPGATPPDPAAIAARLGGAGFGVLGLVGFALFVVLAGVGIAFAAGGMATATAALLDEEYGETGFGHAETAR